MDELSIIDEISCNFAGRDKSLLFGVGDDCALIKPEPGLNQIITTDTMVAGVHFPPSLTWEQVGYRNAATALSDIAAMGGTSRFCFSSLHLSKEFTKEDAIGYFNGVSTVLKKFNTTLAGGNIVTYNGPPQFTLTVMGEVEEGKVLLRNTAQIGDSIFVAGNPGDASAGLQLLLKEQKTYPHPTYSQENEALVKAFIFPEAQIVVGKHLIKNNLSQCAIDCSDGFLSDLGKICEKSGVGALLNESKIPLSPELLNYCEGNDISPLEKAYFGGDDYILVFTVPASLKEQMPNDIEGIPVTEIGTIISGNTISFQDKTREPLSLPIKGYEH